jgi:hypothetical protein
VAIKIELIANSCIAVCSSKKRSQYFIGADDETLSVAVSVHNPDCSLVATHS